MTTATNERSKGPIVLVGIDFSDSSREVLRTAADMTRNAGGELHLVHVATRSHSESTDTLSADRPLELASEADGDHAELEILAKEVAAGIARVVLHTRVGKTDVEIAQLAQDIAADLLVVGSGNPSRVEQLLLGSTASSLVRHAPCPVLAYRPKSIPIWKKIAPPCPDCLAVQRVTQRSQLWCERHTERHLRPHTYAEVPASYGIGAQTFRQG